jgi:hypothetical protein
MRVAEVHELIDRITAVAPGCRDRAELAGAVGAAARIRAWLDGRDVGLAAQLAQVASFPEQDIADAARTSLRDASRTLERAHTAETMPALGDALAAGAISGAHVDVVGRALRQLEPHVRHQLVGRAEQVAALAARATPDELQRALSAEVRAIQRGDGMARLERQQRATRLRTWIDGEGMWCLSGRFDPVTGLRLHGRLSATVSARFAEQVPEHCPTDPLERHSFLQAHALVALTEANGAAGGQTEVVVVLDTTNRDPHGTPDVDWGIPVELPADVLRRLFDTADINPVVLCHGAVIYTPGQVNLGRSTRLANRAQRRALRALYRTCAIPGCQVRFERCHLHHVWWWELGGLTDLHNLLPLCVLHHHAIHDQRWLLTLTTDRQLTITYPDGSQVTYAYGDGGSLLSVAVNGTVLAVWSRYDAQGRPGEIAYGSSMEQAVNRYLEAHQVEWSDWQE